MFSSWLSKSRLYLCTYFRMRSQTLYWHCLVYCTTVLSNENKESSRYGVTNQHEHLIPCYINNTTATRDNKRGLIKTGYLHDVYRGWKSIYTLAEKDQERKSRNQVSEKLLHFRNHLLPTKTLLKQNC